MKSLSVKTRVQLSPTGQLGAVLFIGAPIVAALGYLWYFVELHDSARPGPSSGLGLVGAVLLVAGSSIAWLIGILRLLTGRTYLHEVSIRDEPDQ